MLIADLPPVTPAGVQLTTWIMSQLNRVTVTTLNKPKIRLLRRSQMKLGLAQ
jgi:hypothetical protein